MASVVDKEDFSRAVICRRTRESEARANDMVEESEAWSPVFNLIKDAGAGSKWSGSGTSATSA